LRTKAKKAKKNAIISSRAERYKVWKAVVHMQAKQCNNAAQRLPEPPKTTHNHPVLPSTTATTKDNVQVVQRR